MPRATSASMTAGSQNSPPIEPHRKDLGARSAAAPRRRRPRRRTPTADAVARVCARRDRSRPASSRASTMRTGERASSPGRRQVSSGIVVEHRARGRPGWRRRARAADARAARAAAPVTQRACRRRRAARAPSAIERHLELHERAAARSRAGCARRRSSAPPRTSSPRSTAMPALRSRRSPRPATRGSGSSMAHTTRAHAGVDDGVGARRRHAVVRARLQRHVHGGAARARAGAGDGLGLGVRAAARLRPAARDHLAGRLIGDDRADRRIGRRAPEPARRQPSAICIIWRVEAGALARGASTLSAS